MQLTFEDFMNLASNGKLEKDGITLFFDPPIVSEVTLHPDGKGGKVLFFLEEAAVHP